MVILLQQQGKHNKAMERLLGVLQKLGEVFPKGDEVVHIIEREINSLRKTVQNLNNQKLLNPGKLQDKKILDTMMVTFICMVPILVS